MWRRLGADFAMVRCRSALPLENRGMATGDELRPSVQARSLLLIGDQKLVVQSLRAHTGSPYVWSKFTCNVKVHYVTLVFAH